MGRIRTIKPEFPQSESMGRVSRDARLFFVLLWGVCDDSGRTRGSSRLLASLLYPYDTDAPKLIDQWISQLEREKCVHRYVVDGDTYIEVCNWLKHQKIDKPSRPMFPPPRMLDESSRGLGEGSALDQGSGIRDQGPGTGAACAVGEGSAKSSRRRGDAKDATPEFERFWAAYPRKHDINRCWAIWKRDGLDAKIEEILAGIGRWKRSELWVKDAGKYIKYPEGFLSARFWESSTDGSAMRLNGPVTSPKLGGAIRG